MTFTGCRFTPCWLDDQLILARLLRPSRPEPSLDMAVATLDDVAAPRRVHRLGWEFSDSTDPGIAG